MDDSFHDVEKSAAHYSSRNSPGILIRELDENGFLNTVYEGTFPGDLTLRSAKETSQIRFGGSGMDLLQQLINVFLPTGYPHSVSPDYIDYQIFDSIQAFSSSIASLFANRAVLKAVGVGDESSSSTSALFMKITQETVGRLGTIIFAWKLGSTLEPECKKYRYVADLVNDSATVFDCLSPLFPGNRNIKLFMLCMSGLLRSICGVMAGGSRAALTQHFTDPKIGSIADVNAKDQSQETVITLLGMLAGSVLVKLVQGEGIEMWITVTLLLSLHLFTNYRAVSSVVIRTLNRQRANIVFSDIVNSLPELDQTVNGNAQVSGPDDTEFESINKAVSHLLVTPRKASAQERILEPDGLLRWYSSSRTSQRREDEVIGKAAFGGFQSVVSVIPNSLSLDQVLAASHSSESGYVLYYAFSHGSRLPSVFICLLSNRNKDSDIRAWCHALVLCRGLVLGAQASTPLQPIYDSYDTVSHIFDKLNILPALGLAGWDLARYCVQSKPVPTIVLGDSLSIEKS
ncbi:hypothetical protein AWJ20_3452 [Sugiyamaella lignohabitans]|uniref:Protein root UVB sensitive/RUS domain-containing protein n=1 Tax=Sugiyamaella lignohabitans TaxID=796027 RepID=A0A167FX06_9ASCO|nr:uncharacterized protein AWJ20_3452 [Sugiyamaella lignohabitans]ANB15808.1 hypothetical protein AWJ20_3452 [Sugiyamaella lignohabitans]